MNEVCCTEKKKKNSENYISELTKDKLLLGVLWALAF